MSCVCEYKCKNCKDSNTWNSYYESSPITTRKTSLNPVKDNLQHKLMLDTLVLGIPVGRHLIDQISDWPNPHGFTKGVRFVCLNRYIQVDQKPFGQSEIRSIRVLRSSCLQKISTNQGKFMLKFYFVRKDGGHLTKKTIFSYSRNYAFYTPVKMHNST